MGTKRETVTDCERNADAPDEPSQDQRIEKLKERVAELGGKMSAPDGAAMDPDLE